MNVKPQIEECINTARDAIENSRAWKKVAADAMKDAKALSRLQKKEAPDFDFDDFVEANVSTKEQSIAQKQSTTKNKEDAQ